MALTRSDIDFSLFKGFYKKTVEERLEVLVNAGLLDENDRGLLKQGLDHDTANNMIENVIGMIDLPLGIAPYFKINGAKYVIPMAVDETSVVAAASFAAKLSLPDGFSVDVGEPVMSGEVFVFCTEEQRAHVVEVLRQNTSRLEALMDSAYISMKKRGGGFRHLYLREISNGVVVMFDVDVRDAMGANTINNGAEVLRDEIRKLLPDYEVVGGIVTNLCDKRVVKATAVWRENERLNPRRFIRMYEWACADPYRAATNNKGIMNGVDAVLIATGNDWRAVNSALYTYHYKEGIRPFVKWELVENGRGVRGTFVAPIALGTVGGATKTNPVARVCLKLLGVQSAQELAGVCACVGLANNFAALRAISTEGIQHGHMRLHARTYALAVGAKDEKEIDYIVSRMVEEGKISMQRAEELRNEFKNHHQ